MDYIDIHSKGKNITHRADNLKYLIEIFFDTRVFARSIAIPTMNTICCSYLKRTTDFNTICGTSYQTITTLCTTIIYCIAKYIIIPFL